MFIGDFMLRMVEQFIVVTVLFVLVLGLTGYILRIRIPLAIGGIGKKTKLNHIIICCWW